MRFTKFTRFVALRNDFEYGKLFCKPFELLHFAALHNKLDDSGKIKDLYARAF